MEELGLLRRAPDPGDRRKRRLYLTPEGESLLDAMIPVADRINEDLLGRISGAERELFAVILARLGER
jgi:DNA-binding MarR family transcriptional regulator